MRILKIKNAILAIILMFAGTALFAQQEDVKKEKKVVIITKTVDENGNVKKEKIVKEGGDADVFIITHDVEGEEHENVNVEVDHMNGDKKIRLRVDKNNGDGISTFEWDGEGEVPDDLLKTLKEKGIELEIEGDNNVFYFDADEAPNQACLGVMLGQKETVENINGEETTTSEGTSDLGVPVLNIIEASGAEDAGLAKDDIITQINGAEVMSIQDVLEALQPMSAGEVISVDYIRDGAVLQVDATLKACSLPLLEEVEEEIETENGTKIRKIIIKKGNGEDKIVETFEWDGAGEMPADFSKILKEENIVHGVETDHDLFYFDANEAPNQACLGVMLGQKETVENINGEETTTSEGTSELGVPVLNVVEASGAEDAGLAKDDIITQINGAEVMSIQNVLEALQPMSAGEVVSVNYLRDGAVLQVNATLKACSLPLFEEVEEEIEWEEEDGTKIRKIIIRKGNKDNETVEEIIEEIESDDDENFDLSSERKQTLDLESIDIFPNPTDGMLTVQFTAPDKPTVVKIVDLSGKEVYSESLNTFDGKYNKEIDLSNAPKGALILSIQQADKIFSEKLILQR